MERFVIGFVIGLLGLGVVCAVGVLTEIIIGAP